ncbi:hypothetical protein FRC15_004206 [Serendipita sp. 397]|nr:hypothetical protein FRC15_004206 [Serendipita sp. 397]
MKSLGYHSPPIILLDIPLFFLKCILPVHSQKGLLYDRKSCLTGLYPHPHLRGKDLRRNCSPFRHDLFKDPQRDARCITCGLRLIGLISFDWCIDDDERWPQPWMKVSDKTFDLGL